MASTRHPIELHLPADPHLLRVARVTVASVAATLPFTLQDIEDLRIAVDELCALLIDGCGPDLRLVVRIDTDAEGVRVDGLVAGAGPTPEPHPVAVELLAMVASDHELSSTGADRTFTLTKRVQVHAP